MPQPPDTSHLIQCYARQEVMFVRGEGCYLTDDRGRRYLDAFAGVAVSALGHGHPALAEAICRQARTLLHVSNHYFIEGQEELARKLVGHAFPSRVFFCNSGAEANEGAYKLVRLWANVAHGGRKRRILAFEGSFHGRTIGALSLTANPGYREPFEPLPAAEFLPFGDQSAFQKAMGDDVAGVFLEPIQGEGGVRLPPPGFFKAVRDACTRHGALLVADEVQTGMGRTGRFFGHQHEGTVPDVMTLAKGIAGGVPAGAVLAREEVAALLKPGLHASTFGGNPLACAAALAVVREVEKPGFLENVAARGAQLADGLRKIFGPDREVRGRGLLLGVQLKEPPQRWVTAAREEGLVVGPSGGNTLRVAPPLVLKEGEAAEILEKLAVVRRRLEG
ncbi:MAG TPA: acetylornithine transaminase [Myxococcaceae bacterium]|nr:acetylornithine transaminase [Myxococcaceae bacterium]